MVGEGKIEVFNRGINGNNTANLLARLDVDCLDLQPDVVVLMIGTNDMLTTSNMLSVEAYETNYRQLISLIKSKAELIMMTIPPVNSEYLLQRVPVELIGGIDPQMKVDIANRIVRQLASEYQCRLIDMHEIFQACGGPNAEYDSLFMNLANWQINDFVHPTINGYRVLSTAVYQTLISLSLDFKGIVCFGDSITYGYKMQGEGSVEGDPYPAVLWRMLNT